MNSIISSNSHLKIRKKNIESQWNHWNEKQTCVFQHRIVGRNVWNDFAPDIDITNECSELPPECAVDK